MLCLTAAVALPFGECRIEQRFESIHLFQGFFGLNADLAQGESHLLNLRSFVCFAGAHADNGNMFTRTLLDFRRKSDQSRRMNPPEQKRPVTLDEQRKIENIVNKELATRFQR